MSSRYRGLFYLILLSPAVLIIREINNDLWFLLNIGRYVMSHGFPVIEPFVLHDNFTYVMQQWLSGILFWLAYDAGGTPAVLVLTGIVFAAALWILFKLAMLVSDDHFLLSFAVTLFSAIGLYQFMVTRPYIFSTLVLILEVYILEISAARRNFKLLIFLPLLSVLLINLHAAIWPLFFVLILPWLAECLFMRISSKHESAESDLLLPLSGTTLLGIVAAWFNPYGSAAMTYLFRSYGHAEINAVVMEMKVMDPKTLAGVYFFGFIALSLAVYWIDRRGSLRLRYVLLSLGLLLLALSSARSLMWYAGLAQFPLAFYLKNHRLQIPSKSHQPQRIWVRFAIAILTAVLLLEIGTLIYKPPVANERTHQLTEIFTALPDPLSDPAIRLYTGYDEGAFAEFMGYRPYIDARAEVFVIENNQQKDVMQEYYDLQSGQLHYQDFLDRYAFTHLLLGRVDILQTYLAQDANYRLVKQVGYFKLYVRN